MSSVITSRELGQAICKHFGIDTAKHVVGSDFEIKTVPGELVTVKLTLMLTADDLAGIARKADTSEKGAPSAGPDMIETTLLSSGPSGGCHSGPRSGHFIDGMKHSQLD